VCPIEGIINLKNTQSLIIYIIFLIIYNMFVTVINI